MNVLITGITGLRNRGVEALVVPTVEQLRQRSPHLPISILTRTPDYDEIRLHQYDTKLIERTPFFNSSLRSRLQRWRAKLPFSKTIEPQETPSMKAMREASVVIASGGDVFSSDYGSLHRHLQPLQLALEANLPVVFLAQSIGPFKTDEEAQAFVNVARRSKLITVREEISYKYLIQKLGLSTDLVKLTADPAFLLAPPPPQQVANMLSSYCIKKDRPVIAVAVSQGISKYSGCDYETHIKAWQQVIKTILDELNAQVLIIPHVQETYASNDDRIAATHLLRSFDFDPRVHLAGADHSAAEFKGLIGACDMVIAERMHAAIAGLSSGICTVAVGYSIKAEGIMTNLLGTESLHRGLLIPIDKFLDPDKTYTAICNAWNCRQEIADQLKEVLPRVKKDSESNFEMISMILNQM
ncbi:putative polysaccharide pyruvyl transferase [Calothrix sp. NIES-2100]|uniref:polysaccharide pyruvyl transferase family protein n=1 Tax=Calothrix sp. NIES-2100 TaxID=1954172 RepID=UPI000B61D794|nr:putative polysaccharide pyruvyl transferase [Calothrix sp. NIES-2100]